MVQPPKDLEKFESFLEIVAALRGPDGCPWDKEQTHRSLTPYAIEEAHELAEAIESDDEPEMIAELGDVLLQVVLHAEIGRGDGRFDIRDVIRAISTKMIRRHPHVFSDVKVAGSSEVLSNWAEIKAQEKKNKAATPETRFDIPSQLPALARAQKIGDKTKRLRFDWNNATEVLLKVDEELAEVREELPTAEKASDKAKLEHEVGDLLFSVAQLARHLGLEAEQCLRSANARFEKRFFTMREQIAASGRDYDKLTSEELEKAWQTVKATLKDSE
jgi:tetrapyrrole methylase family protein/MazG family protein